MNEEIKKISWFKRIFMSWTSLSNYFNNSGATKLKEAELKNIRFKTQIEEKDKHLEEKNQRLSEKDKHYQNQQDLHRQITDKNKNEIKNLEAELTKFKLKNVDLNIKEADYKKEQINLKNKIDKIKIRFDESQKHNQQLAKSIHERLLPLNKINKTFFANSANKGKGELGELQLSRLLEKSDIAKDFYTTNLIVGKGNVEFAIKSNKSLWIPVDSKVLSVEVDEDNKIIIDNEYKTRVLTEVKKIKKYTNKRNTAEYGILVIQNDNIYLDLYQKFPNLFKEAIHEHKIHILSPSLFIQFSMAMSYILEISATINLEQDLYNDIIDLTNKITDFASKLNITYKNFKIAMEKHYPLITTKHSNLTKKYLSKNSKIKPSPLLGEK